ncbi:MAG: Ig-like domain-containing protein [Candidatus Zixiibacteriota bacterium]
MKKAIFIIAFITIVLFMGCGDERPVNEYEYAFPYLEFAERSYLVGIRRTKQAEVFALETYEDSVDINDLVWSSEDESIAEVDRFGIITGVAEGSTKIRVQYDGLVDETDVIVIPEEICSLRIIPQEKYSLQGAVFDYNVRYFNFSGTEVFPPVDPTWESTNEDVAIIDEDGSCQTGNLGSTNIIATVYGVSDTAKLHVIDYNPEGDILPLFVGNYWKYQRETVIDEVSYIDTVTLMVTGDTTLITTTCKKLRWRKDGDFFGETRYVFSDDLGIYTAGYRENDTLMADVYSIPRIWRKYPAIVEEEYNTFERYEPDSVMISVVDTDYSFMTPGGSFESFEYFTTENIYDQEHYYFAPNIGMVGFLGFRSGGLAAKLELIDYRI